MPGVKIGDGAMVAACSVVVNDIPPYAVRPGFGTGEAGTPGKSEIAGGGSVAAGAVMRGRLMWWAVEASHVLTARR